MSRSRTPRELVEALDAFIVGQEAAKRAVAVAVRNRWRRKRLSVGLREEVTPKNILMIGPTGVGKTEIARRLAKLVGSPFVKVEASKFTEVGYVGRDVEGIVRDLADAAVAMVQDELRAEVEDEARGAAQERVLELLVPEIPGEPERQAKHRERFRAMLQAGELDEREVEITYTSTPPRGGSLPGVIGVGGKGSDLKGLFESLGGSQQVTRRVRVPEAVEILQREEGDRRVDMGRARAEGVARAASDGIVFLDEVDKIAQTEERGGGEVSRRGVQRDLLPIVEGTTVQTRHGPVDTDHVLFVAAGAFHVSTPSDLIPELQGRFPIRVELEPLNAEALRRILVEPEAALTVQYAALLETEGVRLEWTEEGVTTLADLAYRVNASTDDIGARRLHTLVERLLERELFEAPERAGETVRIDAERVRERLEGLVEDDDMSRFIL